MPYYMGDYYQGDYYLGDPGIFGSIGKFFKGAVRTVGRVAGGVARVAGKVASALPGPLGVAGTVAGAIAGTAAGKKAIIRYAQAGGGPAGAVAAGRALGTAVVPVRKTQPVLMAPGPAPGTVVALPTGTGGGGAFIRTGRRRMNPANPKALRRALRRVAGFGKLAKRAKRDVSRAATSLGVRRPVVKKGRFGK